MSHVNVPDHGPAGIEAVPATTAAGVVEDPAATAAATREHSRDAQPDEKSLTDHSHAGTAAAPGQTQLDVDYPTGPKFILINVAINAVVFLVALDQTIVATAVPVVTNEFKSFSDVGWYASAYLLTSTAFQPLFGRLYSFFNVKWTFLSAFFIFEIGSLICAVAQNSVTFIVGRAIAGLGLAGGYSGCLIIINMIAPPHVRPLLTSTVGSSYGVGAVIGPLLGGVFTTKAVAHGGWRWCFYLNLLFIPILVPTIYFFLKTPERPQTLTVKQRILSIDWLGTGLILASVIQILMVFSWGGVKYAWDDSKMIGLIIGFVLVLVAFLVDQWYMGERATIPFRILKDRTVWGGSIVNFLVASSYFILLYYLSIYFQSVRGSSAIRSGVQTLPFIAAVIFAVTLSGGLINQFGYYIPYLLFGTALMSIGGGIVYLFKPDSSQAMWAGVQFLAGIGPGISFMIPFLASTAVLELRDIELGSAIVIFFQTLGGTISVSLAQSVFQNKFASYLDAIPGISAASVLSKGVSAFRETTPAELLPAVIEACNRAVVKAFLMTAVFGAMAFVAVFAMDLNGKVDVEASKAAAAETKQRKKDAKNLEAGGAGVVEKS
ncbi:unnamed protein product [Parajaminaea phylloscopi]